MSENLGIKAQNYFILGAMAEMFGMPSEAVSNYFKALFALDDLLLSRIGLMPKDHAERFEMLKMNLPEIYRISDKLFSTYRRTYTKEIGKNEIILVKKRIKEVFAYAKITVSTNEEIRKRIEDITKKEKNIG
jgi:hypothetical protein